MSPTQQTTDTNSGRTPATRSNPRDLNTEIDPTAPAGSKTSLGAESVRDGRPSTSDDVVEGIDEEDPEETITGPEDGGDDR
jgi:hypothetical protein